MSRKRKHNASPTNNKFKTWAKNNWIAITTVFISVLALGVSFQSNILTKGNSSALVKIADETFEAETIMIIGCHHTDSMSYEVKYYVVNEYTFSNTGGRAASLIKVRLNRGDDEFHVRVYTPQSFDARTVEAPKDLDFYRGVVFTDSLATAILVPTLAEPIKLPLKIDSGSGEKWMFQGDSSDIFNDANEAELAITTAKDGKDLFSWEFEFNDGTILKSDKFIVSYSFRTSTASEFPVCQNQ